MKTLNRCSMDAINVVLKQNTKSNKNNLSNIINKPIYRIEKGYRYVEPYIYEYRVFAKERWFGHGILDIFIKEFGAYTPSYYKAAIESGRLIINGEIASIDKKIKSGDLILHKTHRHEPPVLSTDVQIIYEDDNTFVVNKPSSIPVHSCGAYHYNSLQYIIRDMRPDINKLHIIHRLDRLTSGIVIFGKNSETARNLTGFIVSKKAKKTYLALVDGIFPSNLKVDLEIMDEIERRIKNKCSEAKISWNVSNSDISQDNEENLEFHLSCPIRCYSHKDGFWECHQDGKSSETTFRLKHIIRSIDGSPQSIIICKPITGRTHQIRLHLQLMGFPIANDPCYGKSAVGTNETRIQSELISAYHEKENFKRQKMQHSNDFEFSQQRKDETNENFLVRTCKWCNIGLEDAYKKNQTHCTSIFLHALKYELGNNVFLTEEPIWAKQGFHTLSSQKKSDKKLE